MQNHQLVGLSFLPLLLTQYLNDDVLQSCEFKHFLCLVVNQGSKFKSLGRTNVCNHFTSPIDEASL